MDQNQRTDADAGSVAGYRAGEADDDEAVLEALLEEYDNEPDRRAVIATKVDVRFRRQAAVLVQDSSGFTRTVKAMGIVHFLALLQRLDTLVEPILDSNEGEIVAREGDTIFVVFPTATAALAAAVAIQARVGDDNAARPPPDQVNCSIGIGFGDILFIGKHHIAGDEVDIAFTLGEDIAEGGEILLTPAAASVLEETDVAMEQADFSGSERLVHAYRVLARHWGMQLPLTAASAATLRANRSGGISTPDEMVLQGLLVRYDAEPHLRSAIAAEIEARFQRPMAVLVVDSSHASRAANTTATVHALALSQRLVRIVRPILERHGGNLVVTEGDTIFSVFPDAQSALDAALAIRARVDEDHEVRKEPDQVACAMGIGYGDILAIGEHNIAGDEVNVAFKLGEDIAMIGEILLSAGAASSLLSTMSNELITESAEFHISGVVIQALRICPNCVENKGPAIDASPVAPTDHQSA